MELVAEALICRDGCGFYIQTQSRKRSGRLVDMGGKSLWLYCNLEIVLRMPCETRKKEVIISNPFNTFMVLVFEHDQR